MHYNYNTYCFYTHSLKEDKIQKIEVRKCVWICNLHCYQAHEISRRCFLAGIFTSVGSPATIALTFEISGRGVVAALGHKEQGGHPGAMNNSIFCTTPWNFPVDRKGFIIFFQKQVTQQAGGRLYFGFSILFSNLNWNEDVLITINSGRKCTGRRSQEDFISQSTRNQPVLSRVLLEMLGLSSA